jgi:AraC-like DNA-binding protein
VVALDDAVVLAGPATRSTTLRLAPGTLTVGIRFRPGAGPALIGTSAADLRNQDIPVDALWGRSGRSLAERAGDVEVVAEAAAGVGERRLAVLVDGLVERLGVAREPDPVGVGIALLLAEQAGPLLPVLAEDVGLSERQLRRRVEESVGYPPRTLARILRFQRFLRAARATGVGSPTRDLARLAAESGYADQAHLTRESRQLAGLPPAKLLTWEAERLSA